MNDEQVRWCNHIPDKYRRSYRQAIDGRRPLLAIRSKCLDCMNWMANEVTDCTVTTCPLWPYRMGSKPSSKAAAQSNPHARDLTQGMLSDAADE